MNDEGGLGSHLTMSLDARSVVQGLGQGTRLANEFTASVGRAGAALKQFQTTTATAGGGGGLFTTSSTASAAMRQYSEGLARTAEGADRIRQTFPGAQQAMYSFGQLVEDVQYGPRAWGNNVAFVVNQVAQLKATLPAGTTLVQAFAASFVGPGGLVLGVSLAVSLLPKLIDLLGRARREAREMAAQAFALRGSGSSPLSPSEVFFALSATREQLRGATGENRQTLLAVEERLVALQKEAAVQARLRSVYESVTDRRLKTQQETLRGLIQQSRRAVRETARQGALESSGRPAQLRLAEQFAEEQLRQVQLQKEILLLSGPGGAQLRGLIQQNAELERQRDHLLGIAEAERTILEQARERSRELQGELRAWQGAEGLRLATIEQQNERLERQIGLARQAARVQALAARFGLDRAPVPGRMRGRGPVPGGSVIEQEQARGLASALLDLRGAGRMPTGLEEASKVADRELRRSLGDAYDLAIALSDVFDSKLAIAIARSAAAADSLGASVGTLAGAFRSLYDAGVERTARRLMRAGMDQAEAYEKAEQQQRRWFEFYKAAATAQAVISTAAGAAKALEQGGILGLISMGSVIAAGLAQVATIRAQSIGGGGGGASGRDRGRTPSLVGPAPAFYRPMPAPAIVSSPSLEGAIGASGQAVAGQMANVQYVAVPVDEFERVMSRRARRVARVVPR